MERNIDRGLDKRVETQKTKDNSSKSPKTDKIKEETSKKLHGNLKKQKKLFNLNLIIIGTGKAKLQCSFCYRTNTKWVEKYESAGFLGLGSRSIGRVEEIDNNAPAFYRCVKCGEIVCKPCLKKMKSKKGFIFKDLVCPKCGSKVINIS